MSFLFRYLRFHDIIGGIHVPVDDGVDKLNRKYTLLVFLFLALPIFTKQYIGDPIECFAPVYFADHQSRYINSYCWTQSTYYMVPVGDPEDDGDQQEPPDRIMPDEVDYFIGFETVTHIGNQSLRRVRVSYYQWAPLILFMQGLCFYIPFLIWNSCANNAGVKLRRLLKKASDIASLPPGCQQREALLAEFVDQFHTLVMGDTGWCADLTWQSQQNMLIGPERPSNSGSSASGGSSAASGPARNRGGAGDDDAAGNTNTSGRHGSNRNGQSNATNNNNNQGAGSVNSTSQQPGCCLIGIPIIGHLLSCCLKPCTTFALVGPSKYLCWLYLGVKFLYVFNVALQFGLLGSFLGRGYLKHGLELINRLIVNGEWWASPRFPLSTLCQVRADMSGGLRSYTCQCVLPINVFNEKIFSVVWFYMAFLMPLNILSLLYWIYRLALESNRLAYIRLCLWRTRLVELNQIHRTVRRLSQSYLGWDGVFLLRLIEHNHGSIMATLIMSRLWEFYANQMKLQEDANQLALANNAQHTLSNTTTAITGQHQLLVAAAAAAQQHQQQHQHQNHQGGAHGQNLQHPHQQHHHGAGHHHGGHAVLAANPQQHPNAQHPHSHAHQHHAPLAPSGVNPLLQQPGNQFNNSNNTNNQSMAHQIAAGFQMQQQQQHGAHSHHSGQVVSGGPVQHPLHAANTAIAHHSHLGSHQAGPNLGPFQAGQLAGANASTILAQLQQQQAAQANQSGNVLAAVSALAGAATAGANHNSTQSGAAVASQQQPSQQQQQQQQTTIQQQQQQQASNLHNNSTQHQLTSQLNSSSQNNNFNNAASNLNNKTSLASPNQNNNNNNNNPTAATNSKAPAVGSSVAGQQQPNQNQNTNNNNNKHQIHHPPIHLQSLMQPASNSLVQQQSNQKATNSGGLLAANQINSASSNNNNQQQQHHQPNQQPFNNQPTTNKSTTSFITSPAAGGAPGGPTASGPPLPPPPPPHVVAAVAAAAAAAANTNNPLATNQPAAATSTNSTNNPSAVPVGLLAAVATSTGAPATGPVPPPHQSTVSSLFNLKSSSSGGAQSSVRYGGAHTTAPMVAPAQPANQPQQPTTATNSKRS